MSRPEALRWLVEQGAQRILASQDWNPYSPTKGCFDRRYWAWKLVDCPEATFQRHVYPLALLYMDPESGLYQNEAVADAVRTGLRYAISAQHRNGSFDQAFPFEQSWGATAFLVHPMLEALAIARDGFGADVEAVVDGIRKAAEFLCVHDERHGRITNHVAGGALSLLVASRAFGESRFAEKASDLIEGILRSQSSEGWFPEYDGADPGYQTLCLYYLAEFNKLSPTPQLTAALSRSLEFLSWFVHPDGSLGGIYGSRRTSIVYVGGLALLSRDNALAAVMLERLTRPLAEGRTITSTLVDAGNLAPMMTNLTRALQVGWPEAADDTLPCDQGDAAHAFPEAGLHVRIRKSYYAVLGAGNGGTLTVFNRPEGRLIHDDGGYVGRLADGALVTTQTTKRWPALVDGDDVTVDADFSRLKAEYPTPGRFVLLRLLNLTIMRSVAAGNAIKRFIVRRLISGDSPVPLRLRRRVTFGSGSIVVADRIERRAPLDVESLECGRPFSSIHMASAGYFELRRSETRTNSARAADCAQLRRAGVIEVRAELCSATPSKHGRLDGKGNFDGTR